MELLIKWAYFVYVGTVKRWIPVQWQGLFQENYFQRVQTQNDSEKYLFYVNTGRDKLTWNWP